MNESNEDFFGISEAFNHALEWRSRGADSMIRRDVSPALRATDYKCPKYVWYKSNETKCMCTKESKKITVYDDYNSNIPKDQNIIGTLTTQFGNSAPRHGFKIIETNMNEDKNQERKIVEPFVAASRGREPQCLTPKRTEYGKAIRKQYEAHEVTEQRKNIQKLEPRTDGISNTLTSVQKDNLLCEPKILTRPHGYYKGEEKEKIVPAVKASAYADNNYLQEPINATPNNFRIRKLTPRECFRLMDVDDKDIDTIRAAGISDSQQYKLAGNSIVVNVLTEIFRKLLVDTQTDDGQMRMF